MILLKTFKISIFYTLFILLNSQILLADEAVNIDASSDGSSS